MKRKTIKELEEELTALKLENEQSLLELKNNYERIISNHKKHSDNWQYKNFNEVKAKLVNHYTDLQSAITLINVIEISQTHRQKQLFCEQAIVMIKKQIKNLDLTFEYDLPF